MAFKYYITDICDGVVRGTNNEREAEEYAESEDFFVIDATTDEWVMSDGHRQIIQPCASTK